MRRAAHVPQKDGGPLQWANCRMAVGATHLDFHTNGEKLSTGSKMRSYQDDQVGGTDADDLRRAWERGYGEVLIIRNGRYWDDLVEDRLAGQFIGLDIWYGLLPDRCQESAEFGHTIGIAPETRSSGQWLVSDPLCMDWRWMWAGDILKAATEWSRRVLGGSPRRTLGSVTGGQLPSLPLYYTTSIGEAMSGLMFKPTRAVAGVFTYTKDANSIKLSDRSYVPAHAGDERPVVAEGIITDPDMFTGAPAYYGPMGDESIVMLFSRGVFAPSTTGNDATDILLDSRDADWVAHLTPPRR